MLGQYLDGTTDVTRTWVCSLYPPCRYRELTSLARQHFGAPTAEERRAFTRVLQGHIAIDTAIFPNGTTGACSWSSACHASFLSVNRSLQGSLCE